MLRKHSKICRQCRRVECEEEILQVQENLIIDLKYENVKILFISSFPHMKSYENENICCIMNTWSTLLSLKIKQSMKLKFICSFHSKNNIQLEHQPANFPETCFQFFVYIANWITKSIFEKFRNFTYFHTPPLLSSIISIVCMYQALIVSLNSSDHTQLH